jgi:hypothetical protein
MLVPTHKPTHPCIPEDYYIAREMYRQQKLLLCGYTPCQADYICVCTYIRSHVSNAVSLTICESLLLLALPCLSHYVGNRSLKQVICNAFSRVHHAKFWEVAPLSSSYIT